MVDFILSHWAEIVLALMTFAKAVLNLVPSEKPIQIWGYLDTLVNAIISDRRLEKK